MDEFVEKVRRSEIAHPTQRNYKPNVWEREFNKIATPSPYDINLYKVGQWTFDKLNKIRQKLRLSDLQDIPQNILLKYLVGTINWHTKNMSEATVPKDQIGDEYVVAKVVQGTFKSAITGEPMTPDTAIAISIDAARFPLRVVLSKQDRKLGKRFSDQEILGRLQHSILFGQYYSEVERLWGECLWSRRHLLAHKGDNFIAPTIKEEAVMRAVADYRHQVLMMEAATHTISGWQRIHKRTKTIPSAWEINIYGKGKGHKYKLEKKALDLKIPPMTFIARVQSQEDYFQSILDLPLPNYNGFTLKLLLDAWELVFSLGKSVSKRMPKISSIQTPKELIRFAPTVNLSNIIPLFSKALNVTAEQAKNIIDIFITEDSVRQELWFKPLVRLGENQVLPLVIPMIHGSLLRLIEHWMKEGGLDLDQRGHLYEKQAREDIGSSIRSSKIIRNAGIHPKNLFLQDQGQEEEIDIVFWIGNTMLIGEAKCAMFPMEAIDYHNYFRKLEHKADQVKRKAYAAQRNKRAMLKLLGLQNQINENNVIFVPFVLVSQGLGAGFTVDNVPVVDLYILQRYLDGKWETMIRLEGTKQISSQKLTFYSSEEEAEKNLIEYLNDPPQIRFYKNGAKPKLFPMPPISEEDKMFYSAAYVVELVEEGYNFVQLS